MSGLCALRLPPPARPGAFLLGVALVVAAVAAGGRAIAGRRAQRREQLPALGARLRGMHDPRTGVMGASVLAGGRTVARLWGADEGHATDGAGAGAAADDDSYLPAPRPLLTGGRAIAVVTPHRRERLAAGRARARGVRNTRVPLPPSGTALFRMALVVHTVRTGPRAVACSRGRRKGHPADDTGPWLAAHRGSSAALVIEVATPACTIDGKRQHGTAGRGRQGRADTA